jgi:hypothetical protein
MYEDYADKRGGGRISDGRTKEKSPLGRTRLGWQYNIKVDLN